MAVPIQLRKDTAANWTSVNPTLALGEPGFERDTGRIKMGDGSTVWTSLPYASFGLRDWVLNFIAAGDVYIPASVAMTVDTGNADLGTGTFVYAVSSAAAPGTFTTTTLPVVVPAGAWLKVTASAVTGFAVKHLKRTA